MLCESISQIIFDGLVGQLLQIAGLLAFSDEANGEFVAKLERVEGFVVCVEVLELGDLLGSGKVEVQQAVGDIAKHKDGHEEGASGS